MQGSDASNTESSTQTASENGEDQTAIIAGILSSSEKSILGRLGMESRNKTVKSRTKRTKDMQDPQLWKVIHQLQKELISF